MAGQHRSSGGGIATFLTGAWLMAGGRERGGGGRHNYGTQRTRAPRFGQARTQLAERNHSGSMFAYSQPAAIRSSGALWARPGR